VAWLREREALLPGPGVLARPVSEVRSAESVPTENPDDPEGFRMAGRYGLGVWCETDGDSYCMAGRYGQLCFVCPPHEAVVTVTAHVEAGSPRTSITALIRQEILDRL
jgi:hypothetical protein